MDGVNFDRLVKHLATNADRRRLLRGLVGGIGATALAALDRRPGIAAPNACAQACASEPKGPRQAACKQACKKCRENLSQVCFGNQITCCANGECCFDEQTNNTRCSTDLPACSAPLVREGCACVCPDTCGSGEFPDPDQGCACVPFPTCDAGGAPEDCAAGVVTDCGPGDSCACVDNVDGGNACVERTCTFVTCTSGADCDSGPCVSIPDCCGDSNFFCAVPCGAGGASSRSTGWG
jgi:hypothetical protein